jgi:hypothetical protein
VHSVRRGLAEHGQPRGAVWRNGGRDGGVEPGHAWCGSFVTSGEHVASDERLTHGASGHGWMTCGAHPREREEWAGRVGPVQN